jgi:hypothetical protein
MEKVAFLIGSLLSIVGLWKVLDRVGQPGWAALVPFYNAICLLRAAGKPAWWLVLLLIPLVNVIALFVVFREVAAQLGRGSGFALGLVLMPPVFLPLLGFVGQERANALA